MELFKPTPAYALLILGQSSSGKSHMAGHLAQHLGKPVFLVNASAEDYLSLKSVQARLQFENLNLKKLKDSTIVTDDILQLSDQYSLKLKELLCYSVHHCNNTALCVGHSLNNTGLYSLLNFFNFVALTNSPRNAKDFNLISRTWGLESTCTDLFANFLEGDSKYFVINGANKHCTVFDKGLSIPSPKGAIESRSGLSEKRQKVLQIMERGFPSLTLSAVLFDWIFQNFNIDFLTFADLSVTMQNGPSKVEVSIIDYLFFLQNLEKPSSSVVCLHRYFLKNFSFPLAFIKNPALRKLC